MYDFGDARGFIFDCDGTLLDTLDAWEEAERDLFAQAGALSQEQEDEIHAAPIAEAARLLHERYGVGTSADEVLAHLDAFLIPFYGQRSCALPGAVELVRGLFEAGIPCVVVSSSPRRYLEAGLRRAGVLECFAALVSTEDVGVSKQDPRIYEVACEKLGCEAAHAWAVDDAPYAIQVMHECGLNTVCVGERTSPFATLDVRSLEELL